MDASQIQITLSGSLKEYVVAQAANGPYKTPDEYVSALVLADQKHKAIERLEALLQEGLDSGPPIEGTEEFWNRKRRELDEYIERISHS